MITVDIKDFEGLYSIDEFGTVYSLIQNNSRRKGVLKPYINTGGYLRVNLYKIDGQISKRYVHRLVAESFISNPLNLPVINHLDGNKKNNHISNLEWCTQKKNIDHSWEYALQKRKYETKVTTPSGTVYSYRSMRDASLAIFGKAHLIKSLRMSEKRNEFLYDGYLINVGGDIK